jgi:hypothetical protein
LSAGYEITNDTTEGLILLNSDPGSFSLNTTTAGYNLQRMYSFFRAPLDYL